jgi:hypothetical protein
MANVHALPTVGENGLRAKVGIVFDSLMQMGALVRTKGLQDDWGIVRVNAIAKVLFEPCEGISSSQCLSSYHRSVSVCNWFPWKSLWNEIYVARETG